MGVGCVIQETFFRIGLNTPGVILYNPDRRSDKPTPRTRKMTNDRVQSGITRPRVVLRVLSVGKRLRPGLSPGRFFALTPTSRHDWQSEPGSMRGLICCASETAQNRARIGRNSRKSRCGADSGCASEIIAGGNTENLRERHSAVTRTGHADQNPRSDSPLSSRSCPSDMHRGVRA